MNLISIVIVTCNRKDYLTKCIESINHQKTENFELELIIVNDDINEKINSNDFLNLNFIKTKIINNHKKEFMIRCRNIGAKNSRGQYILFIDDDNVLEKNMVKNLYNFIINNESCGIVGPFMYDKNKVLYLTHQKINFFSSKTTGFIDTKKKFYETDGIPNCFMIKSEYLNITGYFNEELRQTYTEPDISFIVNKKLNKKSFMTGDAKIFHMVDIKNINRKIGSNYHIKAYCLIRNRVYIISKYGSAFQKLIFFFIYPAWPVFYLLLALSNRNMRIIKYYFKGFIDGYKIFFNHQKLNNSYIDNEFH